MSMLRFFIFPVIRNKDFKQIRVKPFTTSLFNCYEKENFYFPLLKYLIILYTDIITVNVSTRLTQSITKSLKITPILQQIKPILSTISLNLFLIVIIYLIL